MSPTDRTFPAKVLLFGEYTILLNGWALTLPLHRFSGQWTFHAPTAPDPFLAQYCQWLSSQPSPLALRLDAMQSDIQRGLSFSSSIPMGKGLGSSGALVAAVAHRYSHSLPLHNPDQLQQELAHLEHFFHGKSSGLDPLVSLYQKAILVEENKQIQILDTPPNTPICYLLDSQLPRSTAPLVQTFQKKLQHPSFRRVLHTLYMPTVQHAIRAWLHQRWDELWQSALHISHYQWNLFREMIPPSIQPLWEEGLQKKSFCLKLCGAGGGGYFLIFTPKPQQIPGILQKYPIFML